jgi:hypothetical protein
MEHGKAFDDVEVVAVCRYRVLEEYGEVVVKLHAITTVAVVILLVSSSLLSLHPPGSIV